MALDIALRPKGQPQTLQALFADVRGRPPHGWAWGRASRDVKGVSGAHSGGGAPLCRASGEEFVGTAIGWGQIISVLPPIRNKRVAVNVADVRNHAVALASATTGESWAASRAPSVAFSAASANSGGQGLSLSCDILPLEIPIFAANWLAFMASGRSKYAARFMLCV